jgi:hypothetical protein
VKALINIISVAGHVSAPFLSYEIMAALTLAHSMAHQLATRANRQPR